MSMARHPVRFARGSGARPSSFDSQTQSVVDADAVAARMEKGDMEIWSNGEGFG